MKFASLKKHLIEKWYVYIAWAVLAVAVSLWAFTFVTDVKPEKKLGVFIGAKSVSVAEIHTLVEERVTENIQAVDIYTHSPISGTFPTALSAYGIEKSDILILPESKIPDAAAYFLPLTTEYIESLPQSTRYFMAHDAPFGIKAAKPEGLIEYEQEDYYIFFNRKSIHTGILSDSPSDSALKAAEVFYETA